MASVVEPTTSGNAVSNLAATGVAATTRFPVDDVVVGTPRRLLRVDGATLLAGSPIAYDH
jgi:hypothetical protein